MKNTLSLYSWSSILLSVLILNFFCSCDGKEEPIPSYIHIPAGTIISDYPSEGSNSSKITDVWLFVENNQLGVFELPVTIPILMEGDVKLSFQAGIFADGISSSRDRYPFYTFETINVDLKAGEIDTLIPEFQYQSNKTILLKDDFEQSNNFEPKQVFSPPLFNAQEAGDVFEGGNSACVTLSQDSPAFQVGTISVFSLPPNNSRSYIEMDYKCDETMQVYIYSIGGNPSIFQQILSIKRSTDWNKIYMELTPYVEEAGQNNGIGFGFVGEISDTLETSKYCFDNIKLIHN